MHLKTLTYTSRASLDLSAKDLADIHQTARHLNALDGISGLLVFDGTRFLQVVEGGEEAIDSLLERLRRDPRHSGVEVRDVRFLAQRSFSDWSMELASVSAGYLEARSELAAVLPEQVAPPVRELILRMTDSMATTLRMD